MNIELNISKRTNRSKTPTPDGICVVASAKRHEWRHTVVISHPRLGELITQHQIDQLAEIAALDHARAYEAGAMGPPTATPRIPAAMHRFGFQSEAHSRALTHAAITMISETAAKLEWTVTVTDGDKSNA